jgi:acyl-CoA synthetase (AMP-forming)/AMP-acid ligase II
MYGQTEATARLSYLEPSMLAAKRGSIGMGLASTRLEVLNQDGVPVAAGSEEVGEIVASGPNISPGYWNSPEETARFFRNGRLYTGDLARVDRDGFLYIVDRARDFIKSAGNRISPQEIEEVIASHPDVLHVAVVGVPDELLGEAVAAFAVPRAADCLSEASLKDYCNERLPNHKVPQHIQVMGRLPMNDFGKVLKEELRSDRGFTEERAIRSSARTEGAGAVAATPRSLPKHGGAVSGLRPLPEAPGVADRDMADASRYSAASRDHVQAF